MCMRVQCEHCGKPTWTGCGAHIEQALAGVAPDQRCKCREEKPKEPPGGPKRKLFGMF